MGASTEQQVHEEAYPSSAPIMAVFGSGAGTDLAYAIGNEVGKRKCFLMTGGAGPAGEVVKNKALAGADSAATGGSLAPWIGVPKAEDMGSQPEANPNRSYVLETGLSDERNYLEAVLCDVAIAIAGGDGTTSEVAFCLALGRPTILVGNWSKALTPSRIEDRIAYMAEAIDRRILRRRIDPDLRLLIEAAKTNLARSKIPDEAFPLEVDAALVVQRAKAAVGSTIERAFPDLNILQSYRAPYLEWVRGIDFKLTKG